LRRPRVNAIRLRHALAVALVCTCVAAGQPLRETIAPQIVEIHSGKLLLKAYFWKPNGAGSFPAVLFNHGSGGEDPEHTAGMPMTEAADRLAPVFVKHGYAFLYPFRRGQGLSADQAPFMRELLQQEEAAKGKAASQHLRFVLLTTEQLDDVLAALDFLKNSPGVDRHRIAVSGHSFGGELALLAAEQDPSVRAAVTFGAAADSWERSAELRAKLVDAVSKTRAAILLIQAENDYSTAPSQALRSELERLHKPYLVKIYPPVGWTYRSGHNMLYEDIPRWEDDVFQFLDKYLGESGSS
jgi:carboxymethylenebutenolidase